MPTPAATSRPSRALVITLLLPLAAGAQEPLHVRESITLPKGGHLRQPLIIDADNITIDGNGATIVGRGVSGDLSTFTGYGVTASGRSNITIRNLKVTGFESALVATDGSHWLIEDCDFSGNWHNPDHGWGDGPRAGGMILTRLHASTIRRCRANNNWNGLDLRECEENLVDQNDFSHCSNVCLKLWTASRNRILDNNLSWGLRINREAGEVHARDSTSVLIESGSNDNHFERNNATYGGDGFFIRVLNGWCSTGNVFVENDASYANNNGFESWSPDNTYLRNKANHCSFGFWLGGSDHTVLIGNEAAYNGQPEGFHNAPEPDFIHGGIVIVGGSGTHTLIEDNHCHHNNGAGIVFRGDLGTQGGKWKMRHLIVQKNRLEHNRWGLFARFTDDLTLAANTFTGNEQDELIEGVTNLLRLDGLTDLGKRPKAVLTGPVRLTAGASAMFHAGESSDPDGSPLRCRWRIGDESFEGPTLRHRFVEAGFHRVSLTVDDGSLADLAWLDVYVTSRDEDAATEGNVGGWTWWLGANPAAQGRVHISSDEGIVLAGRTSIRARPEPYPGAEVVLAYPMSRDAKWNLSRKSSLSFWMRWRNPNSGGFQDINPIVRLHSGDAMLTFLPAHDGLPRNLLGDLRHAEARDGWLLVDIPLAGSDEWLRQESVEGETPPYFDRDLRFDTVDTPIDTQNATSMVAANGEVYLAALDGDGLWTTTDGREWTSLKRPADALSGWHGQWETGMLAFDPSVGEQGRLILRRRDIVVDAFGHEWNRLVAYDIARREWEWMPTRVAVSHGTVIHDGVLYGLAHAIGGNYGGPLCRIRLTDPPRMEERSMLVNVEGNEANWFSRAGQMCVVDGLVYGTKNDWTTPQPREADLVGDRLYRFDPASFVASTFDGGDPWLDSQWHAAATPCADLGPLPFEVGRGSSLVALPPNWCKGVGAQGGFFLLAGCSPSNHEGDGAPSTRYALFDAASGSWTTGELPGPTAAGSSAAMIAGKLIVKRGGMSYGRSNREAWIISPIDPRELREVTHRANRARFDLHNVNALSIQLDSIGNEPFDIWIDGLAIE